MSIVKPYVEEVEQTKMRYQEILNYALYTDKVECSKVFTFETEESDQIEKSQVLKNNSWLSHSVSSCSSIPTSQYYDQIERVYGVYLIPRRNRNNFANNPFLLEVERFYFLCKQDVVLSSSAFLSWGGLFHLTLSGFLDLATLEGHRTKSIAEKLSETSNLLNEFKKHLLNAQADSVKQNDNKLLEYTDTILKTPTILHGCDQTKGNFSARINVRSKVLLNLAERLRNNMEIYKYYPHDKIRGDGIEFHFTIADAKNREAMERLYNILHIHHFPLLTNLIEKNPNQNIYLDFCKYFQEIKWELVITSYSKRGLNDVTIRNDSFRIEQSLEYHV